MLRDEPRLLHEVDLGAWASTPRALARAGSALRDRVCPGGQVRVEILSPGGRRREADQPEALAELDAGERVQSIEVEVLQAAPDSGTRRTVGLRLGRHRNNLSCHGTSETDARGMLATALEIVKPHVPWWAPLRRNLLVGPEAISGMVLFALSGLVGFLLAGETGLFVVVTSVGYVMFGVGVWLGGRLMSTFELHEGRTTWQRWRTSVASVVVASVILPEVWKAFRDRPGT